MTEPPVDVVRDRHGYQASIVAGSVTLSARRATEAAARRAVLDLWEDRRAGMNRDLARAARRRSEAHHAG